MDWRIRLKVWPPLWDAFSRRSASWTSRECSESIHLGNESNTVTMLDGHNEVWSSGGADTISVTSHAAGVTIGVATDLGTDMIHLGIGTETVLLDDSNRATMPQSTVELTALPAGVTIPTANIWYGHGSAGNMTLPFTGVTGAT